MHFSKLLKVNRCHFQVAITVAWSVVVSVWLSVAQPVKHSGISLRKQRCGKWSEEGCGQSHMGPNGERHSDWDQKRYGEEREVRGMVTWQKRRRKGNVRQSGMISSSPCEIILWWRSSDATALTFPVPEPYLDLFFLNVSLKDQSSRFVCFGQLTKNHNSTLLLTFFL